MSTSSERVLSRRRYVHLALRQEGGGKNALLLGLVPAAAGTDVRTVTFKADDWAALADQLDAAANALRAHAAGAERG